MNAFLSVLVFPSVPDANAPANARGTTGTESAVQSVTSILECVHHAMNVHHLHQPAPASARGTTGTESAVQSAIFLECAHPACQLAHPRASATSETTTVAGHTTADQSAKSQSVLFAMLPLHQLVPGVASNSSGMENVALSATFQSVLHVRHVLPQDLPQLAPGNANRPS